MHEQVLVTIAAGPLLSVLVVLAGYIFRNANLNARIAEVRADLNTTDTRFGGLGSELQDVMQAEFRATRAVMAKNQSELLSKFARLDRLLAGLEQIVRK
jgi:ATP/maltotriose-dependent transcriptional regulator MalT